ncbi:polysaccharide deacetylase family protein [Youngiibacter multivorans]|uniref:Peptidoglycan/xylan/chitin deacetylase (PgdA/CDA1 family) n=1 Tax=Youngiibacter multivorans TaxID=937251 RepID=A0ABS4G4V6_9CLOT|nr:polysaccharide deacetylase family protein [Youngiibacter multivorans]MBP1919588.1 peptidoglycan/xylan/chitin deacetylase (PgdA/CDA1 family) [Youngiibacter multivorans]
MGERANAKMVLVLTITAVLFACSSNNETTTETYKPLETLPTIVATEPIKPTEAESVKLVDRMYIVEKYSGVAPSKFGERMEGIISGFKPLGKQLALTLDACGGNYDKRITDYLEMKKIKATLFISGKWIDRHEKELRRLSESSLFQIENHGTTHRPLTSDGRSIYGITGTRDVGEAYDEVMVNSDRLQSVTGRSPKFFRSGTAFYDDVSISMLKDLGISAAGYTISGDGGATFSRLKIIGRLKGAKPGDIILMHMNHPESDTYEGLVGAVDELIDAGYEFITMSEALENK